MRRKFGFLSLAVNLVYSLAQRAFLITDIIETVIISVPAQEFFYFIVSAGNLFNQISTHAVPVQMIVTTLFAHEAEVFRIENDIIEYAFFDISITFVTQNLFANSRTRITEIHVKAILMAV